MRHTPVASLSPVLGTQTVRECTYMRILAWTRTDLVLYFEHESVNVENIYKYPMKKLQYANIN